MIFYATSPIWKMTKNYSRSNFRLITLIIFLIKLLPNSSCRRHKKELLVTKFLVFSGPSHKQSHLSAVVQVKSLRWEKRSSTHLTHNKVLDQRRKTCIEDVRHQQICRYQRHQKICRSRCLMQIFCARRSMTNLVIGLSAHHIINHNLS